MEGEEVSLKSLEAIKVYRLTLSYNEGEAYQLNILHKITKLDTK
jgi:hypothetical protein